MGAEANVKGHDALIRLYHQIKDYKSWTLSPDVLQELGIQAFQVEISDDEILQFNPCFFRPYPEKLLHLLDFADLDDWNRGRNPGPPNFDEILKKTQKDFPNGDYLKIANRDYVSATNTWASREEDAEWRAQESFDYIEHLLNTTPEGQPWYFKPRNLGNLEFWE